MLTKRSRGYYLINAVVLTLFCTLFDFLDRTLSLRGYLFAFAKVVAIFYVIFVLSTKKEKIFEKFSPKYIAFVIITFLFTFVLCFNKTVLSSGYLAFFKSLCFLLITILLEELFFRSYAVTFFDEDGVISLKNAIFVVLVFTLCNTPILFFNNFSVSLLTIVYSLALDAFILGLFLSSKSVILCILCSLFIGGTELYFATFSQGSALFGSWTFYLIYVLEILFYLGVGSIFIMRNTVRK